LATFALAGCTHMENGCIWVDCPIDRAKRKPVLLSQICPMIKVSLPAVEWRS